EDGIRDFHVTGVQTCALPISGCCGGGGDAVAKGAPAWAAPDGPADVAAAISSALIAAGSSAALLHHSPVARLRMTAQAAVIHKRSEERRVGEGGGCRGTRGLG